MANDFDLVPVDYDPFTVGAADVPSWLATLRPEQ
jgi:hypothetical protein